MKGALFSISFSKDSPFLLAIGGSRGKLEVSLMHHFLPGNWVSFENVCPPINGWCHQKLFSCPATKNLHYLMQQRFGKYRMWKKLSPKIFWGTKIEENNLLHLSIYSDLEGSQKFCFLFIFWLESIVYSSTVCNRLKVYIYCKQYFWLGGLLFKMKEIVECSVVLYLWDVSHLFIMWRYATLVMSVFVKEGWLISFGEEWTIKKKSFF